MLIDWAVKMLRSGRNCGLGSFLRARSLAVSDYLHGAAGQAVSALAAALRRTEGVEQGLGEGRAEVLRRLAEQDLSRTAFRPPEPARIPACRHLPETVGAAIMVDAALAAALAGMEDELHWRRSEGYSDAVMGQPGFMDNYGYAEIIGPHGCLAGDDFRLGFLLLGPGLHYRDHAHPAPELYWLLTGPSDWRRGDDTFVTRQPGEMIWHRPHEVHAVRTHDQPLLALWVWTRDTAEPARLVEA
jgi:hypothetical protein